MALVEVVMVGAEDSDGAEEDIGRLAGGTGREVESEKTVFRNV